METDKQQSTEWTADHARGLVLRGLLNNNLLNDDMISQQEGEIFFSKPFNQWPKEMQEKLGPHGAAMIQ
jgi:hypothetical protein